MDIQALITLSLSKISMQSLITILFVLILGTIIIIKRKKFSIQKILFPIFYLVVYKTKVGIKFMDNFSKSHPKFLRTISTIGIYMGFLGMMFISYTLISNIIKILTMPESLPSVGLVLPIQMKGAFYVPFFYWIISIFILATVHEFSHGVIAKLNKIKIKSSGFGFLSVLVPLIPLAFVEPDEKQLAKKSTKAKLAVYAAGPFSNILLGILVLLFSLFIVSPLVQSNVIDYDGVLITGLTDEQNTSAETAGMKENEIIQYIDQTQITHVTNFTEFLNAKSPGEIIHIKTNSSEYNVNLTGKADDKEKAYLGVFVSQHTKIKPAFEQKYGKFTANSIIWIIGLLYWLYLLNIGIGLFNLVPLGPIDGGLMIKEVLKKWFNKKTAKKIFSFISSAFLIMILVNILHGFVR